jgi:hypothetical protein
MGDTDAVHLLGNSGAYGTMPNDIYLRKITATNLQEDPDQIDKHIRSLLVDYRPDPTFLASDEARDPNDIGGGTHSAERINLRMGGARVLDDPYLPDGSFLDHIFAERDSRGAINEPDMRQHVNQQMARTSFINMRSDSDYSVPSEGINPVKMVKNIKGLIYPFKAYFKNFSESLFGWHNGGTNKAGLKQGNLKNSYLLDGARIDLADTTNTNRSDAVTKLSNDPTLSFRESTPDHRVQVARYGNVRASQDIDNSNYYKNRTNTFLTGKMEFLEGELVNKQLAELIRDLEKRNTTRLEVTKGGDYGESMNINNSREKVRVADIYNAFLIGGMTSQLDPAHQTLKSESGNNRIGANKTTSNLSEHVQYNHSMLESMQLAAKQMLAPTVDLQQIREQVKQTAVDNGIYYISKNKKTNNEFSTSNKARNEESTQYMDDTKKTMIYSNIVPKAIYNTPNVKFQDLHSKSSQNLRQVGKNAFITRPTTESSDLDQSQGNAEFGVYDRSNRNAKPLGRKNQIAVDPNDVYNTNHMNDM